MDKVEIKECNDSIRQLLEHEDKVRSQRTNWFLVIQGLLISGIFVVLKFEDVMLRTIAVSLLLFIGMVVSCSFLYAAYLSLKASREGKILWIKILDDNKECLENFPPICLLSMDKYKNNEYRGDMKNKLLPCFLLPLLFSILEGVLLLLTPYLIIAGIFCKCS